MAIYIPICRYPAGQLALPAGPMEVASQRTSFLLKEKHQPTPLITPPTIKKIEKSLSEHKMDEKKREKNRENTNKLFRREEEGRGEEPVTTRLHSGFILKTIRTPAHVSHTQTDDGMIIYKENGGKKSNVCSHKSHITVPVAFLIRKGGVPFPTGRL